MIEYPITDAQLLAYLDGEPDAETAVRISQSPALQQRAAELARRQTFLAATLAANPPDAQTLAEYNLGLLPPDQAAAVAAHLETHPHAAAQLAALQKDWQREERPSTPPAPASPGLRQTLQLWIAERLAIPTAGLPAFAVRGDVEMVVYQAGDVQIILDADDDPLQPGRKTLTGQLLNLPPGDWQARLWRSDNDEQMWETAVSPHAAFLFDALLPGPYTLLFHTPTTEIYVQLTIDN